MQISSVKTARQKSGTSLKDWKTEAEEILKFHEAKQKEFGVSKPGRPDSVGGKNGWGIRDTAKALEISFFHAQSCIRLGLRLRDNPNFTPSPNIGVVRESRLDTLLKTVRTTCFLLKQDKRTVKIGNDLEKALKEYES